MVKGLISFLFYCESGINQYAVQKTLTDDFGANLLLLELVCLRYAVLLYHLRMFHRVFMRRQHLFSQIIFLVFCSVHYMEERIFKYKTEGTTAFLLPLTIYW